jgi:hypothetical protein
LGEGGTGNLYTPEGLAMSRLLCSFLSFGNIHRVHVPVKNSNPSIP